ncbi:septum formation initiator family protein [Paenibacillus sp.]|uniref:FtsB family cell division protein n=1 Tax=Paenibacillus sp. TaxID=58172 RepID=UPI0028111D62|nr:septum formation initiator family protein [Paenibacillus sp.]
MAKGSAKHAAKPKSELRRRRLYFTIIGGVSLWAIFAFWDQSGAMKEKKAEMGVLLQRLEEVRAEHDAYQSEVTRLQDPEYIEQKVRKDFGMTRPGDKVFGTPAEE